MRDIVLAIDVVEPGLVKAVNLLSKELGRPLKGVKLVHSSYLNYPGRTVDPTGLFEEIIVDFDDADKLQKTLQPFADRILAVTARREVSIPHFSKLVPFVPYVNTPTETSLLWAIEKPLMRDRLKNHDATLVPNYVRIENENLPDWKKLVHGLTYPVIVKPGSLWSSFLVTRCENELELGECLRATFEIISNIYGRYQRDTKPVLLVEEMIQGDMYSIDAYASHDGTVYCLPPAKVITADSLGLPGFYGYSVELPTGLPKEEIERAYDAAMSAVHALHLRSTTVHIELFQTADGWKIIELGARIGGRREELYREVYGIEHYYNDLAIRAGMKPKIPTELLRHARSEDLYADEEGIVEAIEGIEEARKLESMVKLNIGVKPGDKVQFADKGGNVLVDAILSNPDKDRLKADAAKLREVVKFKVKPTPAG